MKGLIYFISFSFFLASNVRAESGYRFETRQGRQGSEYHLIVLLDSKGSKVWETSDFSNSEYIQGTTRMLVEDLNIGIEAGYVNLTKNKIQELLLNGQPLSKLSEPYTQRPFLRIESAPKKGTSLGIVNKYRQMVQKLESELNQCRGAPAFVQVPESEASLIDAK